jgi:hypothetical protein
MGLVDSTGRPVSPSFEDQVVSVLKKHELTIQHLANTTTHLGLLFEFLMEELEKHDIKPDMDTFPPWAKARLETVKKEIAQAQMAALSANTPEGLDLDE